MSRARLVRAKMPVQGRPASGLISATQFISARKKMCQRDAYTSRVGWTCVWRDMSNEV